MLFIVLLLIVFRRMKTDKLNQLVNTKVAEQLQQVKNSKKAIAKKTEPKAKKEKSKKLVPIKGKTSKKDQVVKETEQRQQASLVEKVIAHREVKYIYPADVQDTLARKKWRQATRNKLHELERKMNRLREADKKEFEAARKAYEDFKAQVLKPEQVA